MSDCGTSGGLRHPGVGTHREGSLLVCLLFPEPPCHICIVSRPSSHFWWWAAVCHFETSEHGSLKAVSLLVNGSAFLAIIMVPKLKLIIIKKPFCLVKHMVLACQTVSVTSFLEGAFKQGVWQLVFSLHGNL